MHDPPAIGFMLKRLSCSIHGDASRHFSDIDLTPAQAQVLIRLHRREDETAKMKEMEADFHVSQPTMSGLIMRLEKKKLVETFQDAHDARVKCVRLTDAGRSLCDAARSSLFSAEEKILSCLTQNERDTLSILLQRMCRHMEETQ